MGLGLGVLFIWMGAACLWVSAHGTDAKSPWMVYQQILGGIKNSGESGSSGSGSGGGVSV